MSQEPTREWLVENFADDGRVRYCPSCRVVPLVPFAGGCACGGDRMVATVRDTLVPWVDEDVDPDRLRPVESEDHPGEWSCFYEYGE